MNSRVVVYCVWFLAGEMEVYEGAGMPELSRFTLASFLLGCTWEGRCCHHTVLPGSLDFWNIIQGNNNGVGEWQIRGICSSPRSQSSYITGLGLCQHLGIAMNGCRELSVVKV